ncbi:MAG: hypothetical protein IJ475_01320 [Bacilli bacterium]|nr:hypothetical protein [Bacilli bacterium]
MLRLLSVVKMIDEGNVFNDPKYELSFDGKDNIVVYSMYDINEDIEKVLFNKTHFNEFLDNIMVTAKFQLDEFKNFDAYRDYLFLYKYFMVHGFDSFEFEEILLSDEFTVQDIRDLVQNNGNLFSRCKVIYNKQYNLDIDSFMEAKMIDSIFPGMLFNIAGNNGFINILEFEQALPEFNKYINDVNIDGLSPLERLIYIYDVVRGREYVLSKSDDIAESRDLSKVLTSDEIVCAGFINIFNELLNQYGIPCKKFYLYRIDDPSIGHVRSAVYVKDDKYGVDGVYFCDPTWDCKLGNDNSYLYGYKQFCNTYDKMVSLDGGRYSYKVDLPKMYSYDELVLADHGFSSKEGYVSIIALTGLKISTSLGYFSELMDLESIPQPTFPVEVLNDKINFIKNSVNVPIQPSMIMTAINNVRKLQYYKNPSLYGYDEDILYSILTNSEFSDFREEERLLNGIFGKEIEEKHIPLSEDKCDALITRLFKDGMYLGMKRVQFAKVLRDIAEKKKNEEQIKLTKKN